MRYFVISFLAIFSVVLTGCSWMSNQWWINGTDLQKQDKSTWQAFSRDSLLTNTDKASIPLDQVLDWWPWKDGIPSLSLPKFVSHSEVDFLSNQDDWIAVVYSGEARFYPFTILNRHEIVNDSIDDYHFVVTFCPLCRSAIVFDPVINEEVLEFGVSGKLYQSNLLMYDYQTESLWSQAWGKAVVGDYLDTELPVLPFSILLYEDFEKQYPGGRVLSDDTGYTRNYTSPSPYGNYDENGSLYFPVNHRDDRLHPKEIMYVVRDSGQEIAFVKKGIRDLSVGEIIIDDKIYTARWEKWAVVVYSWDEALPWFEEMWFSWINKFPESSAVRWIDP